MVRTITSLLIVLLAVATFAACTGSEAAETPAAPPPAAELPADVRSVAGLAPVAAEVVTAAGEAATGTLAIAANGEFLSPSRSEVTPKVVGRVGRIHLDEGARVRRGQPLLSLETDYFRLEVERADAMLAQATAVLAEAERDFQRKTELRQKESVPQATLDRSLATFDQARAGRAAASTNLKVARQRLEDSVLRSPLDGVVAERRVDVGEFLGDGGVAFVVIQTAPLRLRFQVPEKYLGRLREGQSVSATVDPYPGEVFEGTIQTVGGVIDPQTRTMFAEAEFANRDGRLRPGLFARVETALE